MQEHQVHLDRTGATYRIRLATTLALEFDRQKKHGGLCRTASVRGRPSGHPESNKQGLESLLFFIRQGTAADVAQWFKDCLGLTFRQQLAERYGFAS